MASSIEQQDRMSVYYCHSCQATVQSKEALCPKCSSEFVEEIEQPHPPVPIATTPTQLFVSGNLLTTSSTTRRRERQLSDDEGDGSRARRRRQTTRRNQSDIGETLGQYLVQLIQAREQLEDSENYTLPVIPHPPQILDLMFRVPSIERLNPQSSTFAGALHTFVARLVEQIENSEGAPPAEQDKIDLLPIVPITQEMVTKENECSICKEAYTIEETSRQLPCKHLFHDVCIQQWLKLRDTCPTCRYSLNQGKVMDT